MPLEIQCRSSIHVRLSPFRSSQHDWIYVCGECFQPQLYFQVILCLKINSIFLLWNVFFFLELNQLSMKGELKAHGAITYDSTANKLRFRSNESQPTNGSMGLDLLMFFNEVQINFLPWAKQWPHFPSPPSPDIWPLCLPFWQGIFYEIDNKNESCEKKKLHCSMHPLDIPDDSKFHGLVTFGNPSIYGEGLKIHIWTGSMPESKGRTGALRWELCYKNCGHAKFLLICQAITAPL